MKTDIINNKIIKILVVVRDNCKECDELTNKLMLIQKVTSNIELVIFNISTRKNTDIPVKSPVKIFITPALFVNGKLKNYGDISITKLNKILTQ